MKKRAINQDLSSHLTFHGFKSELPREFNRSEPRKSVYFYYLPEIQD